MKLKAENSATPLDSNLLVASDRCRSAFARTFETVDFSSGKRFGINCHSWRCPVHRTAHGKKWQCIICNELENSDGYDLLLVNLTTAEFMTFTEIKVAMRRFMEFFRRKFGKAEYVKFVEFNRKQTQPHFHLVFKLYDYKLPPLPPHWFKVKKNKKRSFPENVFEFIKATWEAAIEHAAPGKRAAKVVWCQPPQGDGKKAASYAVGYVSGDRAKKVEEEPGDDWKGRRMSYSDKFFRKTAFVIWRELLEQWHPNKQDTRFCWQPIELETDIYHQVDRLTGEVEQIHYDAEFQYRMLEHPKVKARAAEYQYYQDHGHFFHLLEPGELPLDE
jgi:hypothetical protein